MAGYDFEFYETGRISVTAGQKAFSGTGTAWKLRGCEGALVIVAGAGAVNFVSALSTDAAGEFRTAWTGPTLANAQYTMWLPSAVAATALANHQRLAEIITSIHVAQPESANLTALAGLTGDAETLVRFLANGSFDLVRSKDVGIQDPKGSLGKLAAIDLGNRQILQTDGAGALTALALAARQILQTDANGALKALSLTANKFLSTDTNGDLALSDPRSLFQWNWIYNGGFTINQRGGVKKPANGVYGFDMWKGHANGIQQIVEALPAGEYTLTWSGGGTGYIGSTSGTSPLKATVAAGNTSIVVPQTATNVSLVFGDATDRNPWLARSTGFEMFLCQRYYETGKAAGFALHRTLAIDVPVSKLPIIFKATKRTNPTTTISYTYQDAGSWIRTHNLEGISDDKAIATLMTGSSGYCDVNFNWAADASL